MADGRLAVVAGRSLASAHGTETTITLSQLREKSSSWTSPLGRRSSLPAGDAPLPRHRGRSFSMPSLFLCVEAVSGSGFEDRNDALGFLPFGLDQPAPTTNRVQTLRAQANGD